MKHAVILKVAVVTMMTFGAAAGAKADIAPGDPWPKDSIERFYSSCMNNSRSDDEWAAYFCQCQTSGFFDAFPERRPTTEVGNDLLQEISPQCIEKTDDYFSQS